MPKYAALTDLNLSPDVLALNPDLRAKPTKQPKTDARRELERQIRESFARQFETIWQRNNGPALEKEYAFCAERLWRADYFVESSKGKEKWLIELEGGVFSGGRHSRGKGFCDDAVKYNRAAAMGFRVIRIPTGMATDSYLNEIIQYIKNA